MPISFWKFVFATTLVFSFVKAIFSGRPLFDSGVSGPFWLAVVSWGAYRWARLQVWWPFQSEPPEYKQVEVPIERVPEGKPFTNPITANDLKSIARQVARSVRDQGLAGKKNVIGQVPVKKMKVEISRKNITEKMPVAKIQNSEAAAPKSLSGIVRKKTIRSKAVRKKMVRRKRQPELT